jgi:hypothetical protein
MLEGALVGWGQAWAVGLEGDSRWGFVRATAAGFAIGWTIGIAASWLGIDVVFGEALAGDVGALVGAPLVGAIFGAIVAPFQAPWLEACCPRRRWVAASALAWGLGFIPPQALAWIVQAHPAAPDAAWMTALSGLLTGGVVGAVLGSALRASRGSTPSSNFAV